MNASPTAARLWAVVPAAGHGRRMRSELPKQYLRLAGRSMLDWTLARLLACSRIERVVVCVAAQDQLYAQQSCAGHPRVLRATGGAERAASVLAGLQALAPLAAPQDWVLVHDAARPLLHIDDLQALLAVLEESAQGAAILAAPVADTLKRADEQGRVSGTASREGLWQAQTPQAARYAPLHAALQAAQARPEAPTDEAQALEQAGEPVRLVAAQHPNFKVTTPADRRLAEALLAQELAAC